MQPASWKTKIPAVAGCTDRRLSLISEGQRSTSGRGKKAIFQGDCSLIHAMVTLFLRAKAECFARLCHRLGVRPSVCPSVRPSVTLVICIKTVQARITKSSLWAAPRSLVYRDKISCHWLQGFPSNEGVKEGYPP